MSTTVQWRVRLAHLTILLSCLVVLVGCRDATAPAGPQSLRIVRASGFIREIGDTMRLQAVAVDADSVVIQGATVVWTSTDSSVVSASPDGVVRARGYGSAGIVAEVGGVKARYDVTVPRITAFWTQHEVHVGVGDTATVRASVTYSDSPAGWGHSARWTVRDTSLATVDSAGRLRGKDRVGVTFVVGAIDGFVDSTVVIVWNPAFHIWADTSVVPVGATRTLRVQRFTISAGVAGVSGAAWSSSDPAVASVDASGVVTARQAGRATIVAERDGQRAAAEVVVPRYDRALRFTSVGTDLNGACALDEGGALYCWGDMRGMLDHAPTTDRCEFNFTLPKGGFGRTLFRCTGTPVPVSPTMRFSTLTDARLALTDDGSLYALETTGPRTAAPGYRFRQASAGSQICGVALDDVGYCWGSNFNGMLGIGSAAALGPYPTTPQEISGGIRWRMIEVAPGYACGLSLDGQAYCWGGNARFGLGVGPDSTVKPGCTGPCVLVPTQVRTSAKFVTLASRGGDSCATTSEGQTYCWGILPPSLPVANAGIPVHVASAPAFRSLNATAEALCGVSVDGGVYCLVRNEAATDPAALYSFVRQPVPFAVRNLSMGLLSSCAIAALDGRVYCWGTGALGRLGDGQFRDAPASSPAPVARQ